MRRWSPFDEGVKAALDSFGLHRRMPDGPLHLGAERLAQMLQQDDTVTGRISPKPMTRAARMNLPTSWGEKVPIDSGSTQSQGLAGLGPFGGV